MGQCLPLFRWFPSLLLASCQQKIGPVESLLGTQHEVDAEGEVVKLGSGVLVYFTLWMFSVNIHVQDQVLEILIC